MARLETPPTCRVVTVLLASTLAASCEPPGSNDRAPDATITAREFRQMHATDGAPLDELRALHNEVARQRSGAVTGAVRRGDRETASERAATVWVQTPDGSIRPVQLPAADARLRDDYDATLRAIRREAAAPESDDA